MTFNTNFRRIVRITRFFYERLFFYIKYRKELGLFLKEIRVIRTIRLKFVLNGVENVWSTLNAHFIQFH
jgi:hypothetical protein